MALSIDYSDTKGNFTGFLWYKDGVSMGNGNDPTGGDSCAVGDSVNWCVSASNISNGAQLYKLVLTVGKFQGHNDGTQGSPFFSNSTAQCLQEQTSDTAWSNPVSGFQGFSNALTISQDPGAKNQRSKYEFTLVAIFQDNSGNFRQFGCDPEIDVENGN